MGRIFGTDGVRGIANKEISCELAMKLSRAAAMVVAERIGRRPKIMIGKDTRLSSEMLEAAVSAGLCSVGADAIQIGLVPTPALAFLVGEGNVDAGIMLSASHNPYEYNGIKIFGHNGQKLSDSEENEIEAIVLDKVKPYPNYLGSKLGRIERNESLVDRYIDHLLSTVSADLSELRVLVDCANGSAVRTARKLFDSLEIDATVLYDEANGININNECGSTNIERLSHVVKDKGYDIGIAYDGDADRCLAVDEVGNIINGDMIIAILANDMKNKGRLNDDTIVGTVMSNLGLFKFAEKSGIHVETTKVGDRHVLKRIMDKGYSIGGEQSGHVIISEYMSTGDGQLTSIQLLQAMVHSDKRLSELASIMPVYPQVIKNIHANPIMKKNLDVNRDAKELIADVEKLLGNDGRVLVRASGTEPLIRVMIEGKNKVEIRSLAEGLAESIEEILSDISCGCPL